MSDDRINEVSTHFLGQPRRRALRWPRRRLGERFARLCGISAVSCLIPLPPLAFPSVAVPSPLPPWVATSHRHDPGAPAGAPGPRDRAVRPGLWLAWYCSGRLGTGGTGPSSWRSTQPRIRSMWPTATTTTALSAGDTVSVIDTRHCNADDVSRCQGPWPTVTVGNRPSSSRSTRPRTRST